MRNDGLFYSQPDAVPIQCKVSAANDQVFIYLQNPERLLVWTIKKTKEARFDGENLTIHYSTFPEQILECNGEVATAIYTRWLERDVPKKEKSSFTYKHLTLIAVAGLIITGLIFYFINSVIPAIAARSANWVPVDWEISLGEKLSEAYILQSESGAENDSTDVYFARFVSKLNLNTHYPIHVRLIRSEEINAFALPGGNIFIYSGLLKRMKTHEELVALLGHEISHVTKRHSLKSIMSTAAGGMLLSAFFGDMGGVSSWIISKAGEFKQLEYSRELETEADNAGLELMAQNNVDPEGMRRLLKLLQEESGEAPELMKYLSTHPDTESRIKNVETNRLFKSEHVLHEGLKSDFERVIALVSK